MAKIALSLSGGGFRAATYHLGVLSYLNHLKTQDGTPLLDQVSAVSTISGGTLTGLWFILRKSQGWSNERMLGELYRLLTTSDICGRACREFLCSDNKNHSLIREMVRIYDEEIFQGATLGDLMEKIDDISIDDFSANATEFVNSVEFRFQVGKAFRTKNGGTSQGVIGNAQYRLPKSIAAQVLLAEVFAASSCFPGGFEPLFFPRDFQLSKKEENADYVSTAKMLPLMDGGIVDNQGIEPINLVRDRRDLDLFIISDADCGQGSTFSYEETNKWEHLNIRHLNIALNIVILATAQFLLWVPTGFWRGFFLGITLIFLALRVATTVTARVAHRKLAKDIPFSFNWKELLTIPLGKYVDLVKSRALSLIELTNRVFMTHIRAQNYATVYNDDRWKNRRIMNALYELCPDRKWDKNLTDEEKPLMEPSQAVLDNSKLATSMSTTLWWSDEHRRQGMPDVLVSTGQYNTCWNLLEYIYRLRRDSDNLGPGTDAIVALQDTLEADWKRFQQDPHWMVNSISLTPEAPAVTK